MMSIHAPSMSFGPTPNAPRPQGRRFGQFVRSVRKHKIIAAIAAVAVLGGGASAAYADTVTNVTYATATATPVVASHVKITSNATSKITLQNEKVKGGSTSAGCYKGSTFASIFKKHPAAKCVVITRNGQTFLNSAISASGKRVWFNDRVGSIDSKAGTKSATWYWVASTHTWHKGNCWNTNKLQGYKPVAHFVSYYHLVVKIKYTLTETLSSAGTVMVTALATCKQGGAQATASAQAIAASTASVSVKVVESTLIKVKAAAKATAKAYAKTLEKAAEAAAIKRAKSTAKGSISITLSAQAAASASCSETTSSTPPSSTPPSTTPPTTPPVTPPVTTPPPTTPPTTPPVTPPVTTPPPTIPPTTPPVTPPPTTPPVTPPTTPPVTPPVTPQAPTIHVTQINQVPFGDSRPDTQAIYVVPGKDSYTITVDAKFGTITNTSDNGNGTYTFTYNAPNDAQFENGGTDTVTVTIKDTVTGLIAQDSTSVTVGANQAPPA